MKRSIAPRRKLQVCRLGGEKDGVYDRHYRSGGNNAPSRVTDIDASPTVMLPGRRGAQAYLKSGYVFWSNTYTHTHTHTHVAECALSRAEIAQRRARSYSAKCASHPVRDNPIKASARNTAGAVETGVSSITPFLSQLGRLNRQRFKIFQRLGRGE